jgi:hypothetical protein
MDLQLRDNRAPVTGASPHVSYCRGTMAKDIVVTQGRHGFFPAPARKMPTGVLTVGIGVTSNEGGCHHD